METQGDDIALGHASQDPTSSPSQDLWLMATAGDINQLSSYTVLISLC